MTTERETCDPEQVSRYQDRELSGDDLSRMEVHLRRCPRCRGLLDGHRKVSALVKASVRSRIEAASLEGVERAVVERIASGETDWWDRTRNAVFSKRLVVPATVSVVLLAVFLFLRGPRQGPVQPSAIINSFTAETSSVMILETPKTRQTILWFREIPRQGGRDDHMEDV